ncbi:MAG: molybdopterin molybdotransferase MoeA [Bacteroidetes bacterium]|nr:molybdopterin molybdotransferase MoeA [Bacteroidota bacterium]
MITVEEAKSILIENTFKLIKTSNRKVRNSSGYFLAEDIFSKLDLPPFNQSNVDGYALKFSDANQWTVIEEIKAGDSPDIKLKSNEAARIFTGAVVPDGADCVVMQEEVHVNKDKISLGEKIPAKGEFIRSKGSQIRRGELAIKQNTMITPAVSGFLSALGIDRIKVYRKPVVYLIITGNELQSAGTKLSPGKVYDSNSYILESALEQMNIKAKKIIVVKDKKKKLLKIISQCLPKADLILISGGVSVGKYDFVNEVLEKLGTKKLFYKISQRPGKPLYFGMNGAAYIFGLPGNPASVLTCFYEFVYPLLRKMQGYDKYFLEKKKLPVLRELHKTFRLSNFLKGRTLLNSVEPLGGQASYILKSFTDADCFIYLPLDTSHVNAGEEVEVHILPTVY